MKAFVVIAIVSFAIAVQAGTLGGKLTEEEKKIVETRTKDCIEETKLDEAVYKDAKKGIYAEDPKLKDFAYCFSKKGGFQNESGEIQFDVIRKKLLSKVKNEEELEKLIKKCVQKMETPEMTAYESMKCLHQIESKEEVAA